MKPFRLVMSFALLLMPLLAAPSLAQIAEAGVDVFTTPAATGSNLDFRTEPLPADFFCPVSAPFAGVIYLKGVPLVTEPPHVAGNTDTIVERLDSVPADGSSTQVVVRALQLKHTQPVDIVCDGQVTQWGTWVRANTAAPPPSDSTMQIYTDSFTSHLVVPATVRFYNIDDQADVRELDHEVELVGGGPWSDNPGSDAVQIPDPFLVDTDGDEVADTEVPGTSNFHPGWQGQTRVAMSEAERLAKHGIKPPRPGPIPVPVPEPIPTDPVPTEPSEPGQTVE